MANSLEEEIGERRSYVPKIQVAMPKSYGTPTANGKWENTCMYTGMVLALTADEWEERYRGFRERDEAEREAKRKEEEEKRREEAKQLVASLPKAQTWIRGADCAKRVLGRNNLVGKILKNHDVVSDGGIIIPACARETDKDFEEVMLKSTFIEVHSVSDWIDDDFYPWLREAKNAIAAGLPGPIIEINPGSGVVRRGENGEACLFINAQWCWLEYENPKWAGFMRPKKPLSKLYAILSFLGFRGNGQTVQAGWRA